MPVRARCCSARTTRLGMTGATWNQGPYATRYTPRTRDRLSALGRQLLDARYGRSRESRATVPTASSVAGGNFEHSAAYTGRFYDRTGVAVEDSVLKSSTTANDLDVEGFLRAHTSRMSLCNDGAQRSLLADQSSMDTSSPVYHGIAAANVGERDTEPFIKEPNFWITTGSKPAVTRAGRGSRAALEPRPQPVLHRLHTTDRVLDSATITSPATGSDLSPQRFQSSLQACVAGSAPADTSPRASATMPQAIDANRRMLYANASPAWNRAVPEDNSENNDLDSIDAASSLDPASERDFYDEIATGRRHDMSARLEALSPDRAPSVSACSSKSSPRSPVASKSFAQLPDPVAGQAFEWTEACDPFTDDGSVEDTSSRFSTGEITHRLELLQQLQERLERIREDLRHQFESDSPPRAHTRDQNQSFEHDPKWRLISEHTRCLRELWRHESNQASELRSVLAKQQQHQQRQEKHAGQCSRYGAAGVPAPARSPRLQARQSSPLTSRMSASFERSLLPENENMDPSSSCAMQNWEGSHHQHRLTGGNFASSVNSRTLVERAACTHKSKEAAKKHLAGGKRVCSTRDAKMPVREAGRAARQENRARAVVVYASCNQKPGAHNDEVSSQTVSAAAPMHLLANEAAARHAHVSKGATDTSLSKIPARRCERCASRLSRTRQKLRVAVHALVAMLRLTKRVHRSKSSPEPKAPNFASPGRREQTPSHRTRAASACLSVAQAAENEYEPTFPSHRASRFSAPLSAQPTTQLLEPSSEQADPVQARARRRDNERSDGRRARALFQAPPCGRDPRRADVRTVCVYRQALRRVLRRLISLTASSTATASSPAQPAENAVASER